MILSLSIATVVMGTSGLNLVSPVFAGGDHHHHDRSNAKTTATTTVMTHTKLKKYMQRMNAK